MTGYLLDVNVLIALIDPSHIHHDRAHDWFAGIGSTDWLSCPTTQNGTVRVVSHPRYSNAQPTPLTAIQSLRSLCKVGRHRFVADRVSLLDATMFKAAAILSSTQITDSYLIALAQHEGASLATFDRRIVATAVRRSAAVTQIP